MKNKEIEELLNELKDNNDWYVIENKEEHNTEPYKLLLPTERNLLLSYIEQLENTIDDMTNISYKDYDSWLKNNDYVKDLESFANQINYDMNSITTLAYRTSIKNAIQILIKRLKETYTEDTVNELKQKYKQLQNNRDKAIEVINTQLKNVEGGLKDNLRIIAFNLIKGSCTFKDLETEEDYKYILKVLKGDSE